MRPGTDLPVLLPPRALLPGPGPGGADPLLLCPSLLVATAAALLASAAVAQTAGDAARPGAIATLLKWAPLVFSGFLLNVLVSVLSMALGTLAGAFLGLAQVSLLRPLRRVAWAITQFFRNAPWLVLLFYAMFLLPFEVHLFGLTVAFPAWAKAVVGLALPVAANVAEIVRGGVQSIPAGQWESAESLAFSRRQTLTMVVLPQAVKRMIPPWMNLYAILTMATTLISIVGLQDGLTIARAALVAESRPELLVPMYLMLLLMFFAYCYPIARWTLALERRFAVRV